ncbi:DUF1127 domain-containing protein [Ruegeria sp. HKCCD7255]|uniref:DUF1127 domain-containing protein n=1 Tax=Ruegeria sp. HKCCD7255 TaxID=2683004 RepID=UPI001489ED7A|nr:DUF1127 domain-containing protein [Ruegeria sp. HKCCD7255]
MTQLTLSKAVRARRVWTLRSLWSLLSLARQRRALAHLDEHALEDIGVTRDEACKEAKRPIWDVPDNWLKELY